MSILNPDGFDAGDVDLPDPHPAIAPERREAAALMVLAITRGATPEDNALGVSADTLAVFGDELERAEALAHVDLLAAVLAPLAAA